jgi:HSP20 family protein
MSQPTTIEKRPTERTQPERVRSGRTYVPVVDIIEKPNELLLMADVPGVSANDLNIQYEQGLLSLNARVEPRQDANVNYLLREYGVGDFSRTFQIGEGIDAGRIEAEVKNGVLTLHLPKSEAARPRKIAVKAS